ncbi:MAG TPA: hypothetical protein VGF77_15835 [Allosphingosinicella sp.]|jgi:hypothetical protein
MSAFLIAAALASAAAPPAAPIENFKSPNSLTGVAKPTTAEVKRRGGRLYLRLEQVTQNATARVFLSCSRGRATIRAGIVTTPDISEERAEGAERSYLELDWRRVLAARGRRGLRLDGNTVWISRDVPTRTLSLLPRTRTLGLWVENGGVWRWGALMDLRSVHPQIGNFVKSCR